MESVGLVTGGATRVGKLISSYLVSKLDQVVVIYHSSSDEALNLQKEYGSDRIILYQCDFNDYESLHNTFDVIFSNYSITLLINNASIMNDGLLKDVDYESLITHYNLHLFVPILLTQYMVKQGIDETLIINMLDIKINTNQSKRCAYLLSKKSLADFTKMAGLEFASSVRVNGIALGWIYDPIGSPRSDELKQKYTKRIPLQRKVEESELLQTIDFLLENKQLTGQCINLAGGSELTY